jgi:putative solute:sodium symporter small subunit
MTSNTSIAQLATARWRKTLLLTSFLLGIGFVVTFVVAFFGQNLNFELFGSPFYFWVGSQGALLVYLLIVCVYAASMNRMENADLANTPTTPAAPASPSSGASSTAD